MAKKRPSWRKWMLILLLVLPLGLLAGLLLGKTVDPSMLFKGGESVSSGRKATKRADAEVDRRNRILLEEEEEEEQEPSAFRPEFDYEEEVWPGDYAARRDGDPDEYGYYRDEPPFTDAPLFEDDFRPAPEPEPDIRAQDRAPATTSPDPSARYAPLGERDSDPAPPDDSEPAQPRASEPRTADGDLPAIW